METLLLENGHRNRTDLLLKIDVEGVERQALVEMPDEVINQFDQIVIEFHNLTEEAYSNRNLCLMSKLLRTHTPIHIHANNCDSFVELDDLVLPNALEVSYVRTTNRKFRTCNYYYPRVIDVQNTQCAEDIKVGLWNLQ